MQCSLLDEIRIQTFDAHRRPENPGFSLGSRSVHFPVDVAANSPAEGPGEGELFFSAFVCFVFRDRLSPPPFSTVFSSRSLFSLA
ncbi:UNVERIFIED_CONTAM: hypothetical protein HHA_257685 [Hammondia hammondi]|eukprot:XP_008883219.1 hypothetical protein HHA_257685 [Hammondia hammondi]